MDIFSTVLSWSSGTLGYVIPFLFVLSVVVFFHELGHFLVARFFGVKVEAFSLGFGPEIYGRNDRRGTRWRLSLIPLGGYVKFLGDEMIASKPETLKKLEVYDEATRAALFQAKPVGQRMLVVLAGPFANFLLAILIFATLFTFVGRALIDPRVGQVIDGSPAQEAGFHKGDVVLQVDNHPIRSFSEIQRYVAMSDGQPLEVRVRRDEGEAVLNVKPRMDTVNERVGGKQSVWRIGLAADFNPREVRYERHNPLTSLGLAVKETWFLVERTLSFVGDLFAGRTPIRELGGPIRIAEVSGQAAGVSSIALFYLTAVLSVSIGLLNLFPIPMLDGGHMVYYLIEAARRRPLSERTQDIGFRIGLAVVLTLMVIATWNDIARLILP